MCLHSEANESTEDMEETAIALWRVKEEGGPVQILLKTWSKNLSGQCVQIIKIVPLGDLLHLLPLIPVLINGAGRCFMACDLGSEAGLGCGRRSRSRGLEGAGVVHWGVGP